MSHDSSPACAVGLGKFLYLLAGLVALLAVSYPLFHEFSRVLPVGLENFNVPEIPDNAEATTGALLQAVFFLTTISFGLTAAAFVSANNKKSAPESLIRPVNTVLLSILLYFLSRVATFAYEVCLAVVVQLDARAVYLSLLNPLIEKQALSVLAVAFTSILIIAINFFKQSVEGP